MCENSQDFTIIVLGYKSEYLISFSLSGTHNQGADEALFQADDSTGEEESSHHYDKVCYLVISSK